MSRRRQSTALLPGFLLILSLALTGQAAGQDAPAEDEYTGEGFSLQGASGFFNVLSPILIRPGNILTGFSYRSEFGKDGSSAPPVTIGYGLAKFSEVYVAFEPRNLTPGNEENEILIGVKMLGLLLGDVMLGAGATYRSVNVTRDGDYAGRYAHYGAQLLLGVSLGGGWKALGNVGYALGEDAGVPAAEYVSTGAGLSVPLQKSLLLIADGYGRFYESGERWITTTLGGRLYLFEHVQINGGMQLNVRDEKLYPGVMLGVGFSSEILRTGAERDAAEEYFPELPRLEHMDDESAGVTEEKPGGEMPALPSLEELEKREKEKPDVDTEEEQIPPMPSLEELESEEGKDADSREDSRPPGMFHP